MKSIKGGGVRGCFADDWRLVAISLQWTVLSMRHLMKPHGTHKAKI